MAGCRWLFCLHLILTAALRCVGLHSPSHMLLQSNAIESRSGCENTEANATPKEPLQSHLRHTGTVKAPVLDLGVNIDRCGGSNKEYSRTFSLRSSDCSCGSYTCSYDNSSSSSSCCSSDSDGGGSSTGSLSSAGGTTAADASQASASRILDGTPPSVSHGQAPKPWQPGRLPVKPGMISQMDHSLLCVLPSEMSQQLWPRFLAKAFPDYYGQDRHAAPAASTVQVKRGAGYRPRLCEGIGARHC